MSFEQWAVSHARMSSKPHKSARLDDKMSFFHQLSTLVVAGTPLLQALDLRRPEPEPQDAQGAR